MEEAKENQSQLPQTEAELDYLAVRRYDALSSILEYMRPTRDEQLARGQIKECSPRVALLLQQEEEATRERERAQEELKDQNDDQMVRGSN